MDHAFTMHTSINHVCKICKCRSNSFFYKLHTQENACTHTVKPQAPRVAS